MGIHRKWGLEHELLRGAYYYEISIVVFQPTSHFTCIYHWPWRYKIRCFFMDYRVAAGKWEAGDIISFYIQLCKLKTVLGNRNLCILVEILLL